MIPAGIIHQKNNFYTARIVGNCGEFSAQELIAIAQIASTYGNGKITATSRGTIEIEQISPDNIESMLAEIKAHNLRLGGTGTTVRAIVSFEHSSFFVKFFFEFMIINSHITSHNYYLH